MYDGLRGQLRDLEHVVAANDPLPGRHGITDTSGATPFLHDLVSAANLDRHDLSSLTRSCCMGAPIPRAIVREARQRSPGDPDEKVIDTDGYLRISGRTKDVIIRGGEDIPVAYVENVLYEHPDLASVAVVAVPDPRLQERACACVVLREGAAGFSLEEMRAFLAGKGVARQYWPERIEVLTGLPTTPSGKVQKFQLREQVSR